MQTLLHFKWEFLTACLLPYADVHIVLVGG